MRSIYDGHTCDSYVRPKPPKPPHISCISCVQKVGAHDDPVAIRLPTHWPSLRLPTHCPSLRLPAHWPSLRLPTHCPSLRLPTHCPSLRVPTHLLSESQLTGSQSPNSPALRVPTPGEVVGVIRQTQSKARDDLACMAATIPHLTEQVFTAELAQA
jgi:hypothetical protein